MDMPIEADQVLIQHRPVVTRLLLASAWLSRQEACEVHFRQHLDFRYYSLNQYHSHNQCHSTLP
jgi:hypothetical protein